MVHRLRFALGGTSGVVRSRVPGAVSSLQLGAPLGTRLVCCFVDLGAVQQRKPLAPKQAARLIGVACRLSQVQIHPASFGGLVVTGLFCEEQPLGFHLAGLQDIIHYPTRAFRSEHGKIGI